MGIALAKSGNWEQLNLECAAAWGFESGFSGF
jgi:hypothetical protein